MPVLQKQHAAVIPSMSHLQTNTSSQWQKKKMNKISEQQIETSISMSHWKSHVASTTWYLVTLFNSTSKSFLTSLQGAHMRINTIKGKGEVANVIIWWIQVLKNKGLFMSRWRRSHADKCQQMLRLLQAVDQTWQQKPLTVSRLALAISHGVRRSCRATGFV